MPGDQEARLIRLEETAKHHEEEIDDMGGTLDHVVNTIDGIILPTQKTHGECFTDVRKTLDEHSKAKEEAHDYIMSQRGAWSLIQKGGIVIAALSSLVVLGMKLAGH